MTRDFHGASSTMSISKPDELWEGESVVELPTNLLQVSALVDRQYFLATSWSVLCANCTECRFNLSFFISGTYKPFIYWSQFSFRGFCFCFASALQHAEEVQRKGASFARDAMIEENWSKYLRFFVIMPLDRALPLRTAIQMCPVQVRYLVCFINNFYSA